MKNLLFAFLLLAWPALGFGQTVSSMSEITSPVDSDQLYLEGASEAHYGRIELDTLRAYTWNENAKYIGTYDYTLQLEDAGRWVIKSNVNTPSYFRIPANATTSFPTGTTIVLANANSTGTIDVTITSDTLLGVTDLDEQYSALMLVKTSSTIWQSFRIHTGAEIDAAIDAQISGLTEKTAPVAADHVLIEDSAASNAKKRATVENLVAGGVEHGTCTPTIQDNSESDAEGQTYSNQYCHYSKIGEMVFFVIRINVTSLGTLDTGQQVYVAGLPFAPNQENFGGPVYWASDFNIAVADRTVMWSMFDSLTGQTLRLYEWANTTSTTWLLLSELSGDGELAISGWYTTDD